MRAESIINGMGGGSDEKKKQQQQLVITKKLQKSYFDVLGLCCSSEVPLIEKILKGLEGVKHVSVIVPSRTVIVVHDSLIVSQLQIVKALNQARLEANVRIYGEGKYDKKWPSPYAVACGIFLSLSFLKYVYHPMQWLALAAVVVGICPIFLRAVAAVRNFTLDTNILVLIAVMGSIALRDYWEAGSIVFLFIIAQWLESRASHKATAVMSTLMNIVPRKAVIAETREEVDAGEVRVNTIIAVKAGEIIPIDGIVVEGTCEVDEKTLTGESFPVSKLTDSTVWAGTINLNGYISVKTSALAEDCVVAKMAKLVEEAQNNKSRTQRFIDKCAKFYTPAIVAISACLAAVPAILRLHNLNEWLHLALVVLVSACPCALILSTPVATFCALSKAATSGLLVKGGEYLETLSKIKIMAFDKTGTLTRGEFEVTDFRSLAEEVSLNTLIYWVSSVESKSSHPMAAALIDYGRSHSIEPMSEKVEEFENFPGEGIRGKIDGKDVYVGNRRIALRAGCETVPSFESNSAEGKSIGYVFLGSSPAGIFSLSDTCRTSVKEAIGELKAMHIKTAMLTGDSHQAATLAQNQLAGSLDVVHAELLPQDKARIIKDFQKEAATAMVGDGLNDAPALATADIGISMGISGSALATETGHVILMSNDIRKIPELVRLARKTQRKIIENVILSILTKAAILALAFAGHPLVWAAVLADVGTCLVVIFNSMLLLQGKHKYGMKCCKSSSSAAHAHEHGIGHSHSCHSSSHTHQHAICSDSKTKKTSKPQNCCSQRNAPNCGNRKKPSSATTNGCCAHEHEHEHDHKHGHDRLQEAKRFDYESCKESNGACKHTSRVEKKCTNYATSTEHCDHRNHGKVQNNPNIISSEVSQDMTHCGDGGHCHLNHHIADEEQGHIPETCSHEQNHEDDPECTGHGPYLERRQFGGCCKSFRKECCLKNGHFEAGLRGGLSEIVIE